MKSPAPLQDVVHYEVVKTDVGLGRESKYVEDTREADALWEEISFDGPGKLLFLIIFFDVF